MGRYCKTCAHLRRFMFPKSGREGDPHDDYGFRCGWRETAVVPWAEGLLRVTIAVPESGAGIGKRHIEGDWSEVMDCHTHRGTTT